MATCDHDAFDGHEKDADGEDCENLPTKGRYWFFLFVAMIAGFALYALTVGASRIDPQISNTTTAMRYFKDNHGICYVRIVDWQVGACQAVGLSVVPCDKVGL